MIATLCSSEQYVNKIGNELNKRVDDELLLYSFSKNSYMLARTFRIQ